MMEILLKNITWCAGDQSLTGDLRIGGSKIMKIGFPLSAQKNDRVLDFQHHFLYPGLINSHDHLEMNLYPHLGTPPYKNYTQWAKDIYRPTESPVKEIESVPVRYRLLWGGIKNLVSGVTTVVHHNSWHRMLGGSDFPVKVLKKYQWAHSLAFDKKGIRKFPANQAQPFIIHVAEGTDDLAHREIRQLHELNALRKNTVLIHCVGLSHEDILLIHDAGASVIWCPSSNFFMFGQTADIVNLRKNGVIVALGSDSTMTGPSSLIHEMIVARKTGQVTAREVFEMVTSVPARIFNLPNDGIAEGADADLLIMPVLNSDYHENLLLPEAHSASTLFKTGNFLFGDTEQGKDLKLRLHPFRSGTSERSIAFDLAKLRKNILKKTPLGCLRDNPLWQELEG